MVERNHEPLPVMVFTDGRMALAAERLAHGPSGGLVPHGAVFPTWLSSKFNQPIH
jgi:hypothetical protein